MLAYICVAQSETKTGLFDRDECYQKTEDYLANNPGMIFNLERKTSKTGFHIVGIAHAAGCTGLVECEAGITTCTCTVGGASCTTSGLDCGPSGSGTCDCNFTCSGSGGGAMDYFYCNTLTTRVSCLNQTDAESYCNAKILCSVPGGCSWDGGGEYCGDGLCNNGETCSTCPGDCGTCITCGNGSCDNGETCSTCPGDCGNCVDCISGKGHEELPKDCNKTGFYGRSYAILRDPDNPVSETYSCNPYAEAIGDVETCTYWKNKWTGYLTVPQTGDYEFWVTYNPQLIFQMDVNGNGTFDTSCSNASQDPKAGDNYIFISTDSCNNKYRYAYLNSWDIINDALGDDCWSNFGEKTPCEAGRHCQKADLRTEDVRTYPTIINPVPESEKGSTECPISAVNSKFDND